MAKKVEYLNGFFDLNGNVIAPIIYWQYHNGFPNFTEGLARVYDDINNKYGFIYASGKLAIDCIYNEAFPFNNKLARVGLRVSGRSIKYGFIDIKGKLVIPCDFSMAEDFINEFARVKSAGYGIINKKGEVIVPLKYSDLGLFNDGLAKAQNGGIEEKVREKNWSIQTKYIMGKWGFVDNFGNEKTPFIYDYVEDFNEGVAIIIKGRVWKCTHSSMDYRPEASYEFSYTGSKSGLINITGQEIIPCIYDWIGDFKNGTALIKNNNKFGLIDITGNLLAPCIYDEILNNTFIRFRENKKWGIMDTAGKVIVPPKYSYISSCKFGIAVFEYDFGLKGIIDELGNEVISCKYEYLEILDSRLLKVKEKNKPFYWGYINEFSSKLIVPYSILDFQYIEDIGNAKYNIIKTIDKYGIISKTGKIIAQPIYDTSPIFYDNFIKISKNKLFGCLDYNGKELIPCTYNKLDNVDDFIIEIKMGSKVGYIDLNGTQYWED